MHPIGIAIRCQRLRSAGLKPLTSNLPPIWPPERQLPGLVHAVCAFVTPRVVTLAIGSPHFGCSGRFFDRKQFAGKIPSASPSAFGSD